MCVCVCNELNKYVRNQFVYIYTHIWLVGWFVGYILRKPTLVGYLKSDSSGKPSANVGGKNIQIRKTIVKYVNYFNDGY